MKKRPLWPLLPPLVIAIGLIGFLAITQWLKGYHPGCGIHKLTSFYCPGCGGTRWLKSLLKGEISAALGYNALLMIVFTLLIGLFLFLIIRVTLLGKPPPQIPQIKASWIWLSLSGVILFTVLRNIASYPWTLLAP